MKRLIILSTVAVSLCTGCASMHASTGEHFQLSGTPEGIRAFGDTLIGVVKTGKEKPDAHNQYFAARSDYERNVTERNAQPGFLQKLFGGSEEKQGS